MDKFLQIQEIVDEFLRIGFGDSFQAEYTPLSDTELKIDITGEHVSYLIGQHGKTLLSLQHIIRQIYINRSQDYDENIKLIIDIDSYKQKRIERIQQIAEQAIEKCKQFNKPITLPTMTPYERHVVHTLIQDRHPDILSSSIGEDPNRRVVVRPTEQAGSVSQ